MANEGFNSYREEEKMLLKWEYLDDLPSVDRSTNLSEFLELMQLSTKPATSPELRNIIGYSDPMQGVVTR